MNFKELSLTLIVGVKEKWSPGSAANFGVSAFLAGSPLTTFGPVSLVSDANDALFHPQIIKLRYSKQKLGNSC